MSGRMTSSDALHILGVGPAASLTEIRRAYRKQALNWHPDRHAQNPQRRKQAEERFKTIGAAYRRLKEYGPSDASDPQPSRPTVSRPPYAQPRRGSPVRPHEEPRNALPGRDSWANAVLPWLALFYFLLTVGSAFVDTTPRLNSPPPIPEISGARPVGQ